MHGSAQLLKTRIVGPSSADVVHQTDHTMAKGTWTHNFIPRVHPKPRTRQADYAFDMDLLEQDGGFIKYNQAKGRIKVFLDSNGDGLFNKGDQRIGVAKVAKEFRGIDELIDPMETGSVKSELVSRCLDVGGIDDCFVVMTLQNLSFKTSEGDLVALVEVPSVLPGAQFLPGEL